MKHARRMKNIGVVMNSIIAANESMSEFIPRTITSDTILEMISAHESGGFVHNKQIEGPALSFFQVEPKTHADLYDTYLRYRPHLAKLIMNGVPDKRKRVISGGMLIPDDQMLVDEPVYAARVARMILFRVPVKLPELPHGGLRFGCDNNPTDETKSFLMALAGYCKQYYNTFKGKATAEKYYDDYIRYCV